MTKDREILRLKECIFDLEKKNKLLEKENNYLRRRLDRARGGAGEKFVAELTGGVLTKYKDGHDVKMQNGTRLEVKTSQLQRPNSSRTKRWNWTYPLGLNDTKAYDFFVLLGEKDPRYVTQYPTDLEYVCFLIP